MVTLGPKKFANRGFRQLGNRMLSINVSGVKQKANSWISSLATRYNLKQNKRMTRSFLMRHARIKALMGMGSMTD